MGRSLIVCVWDTRELIKPLILSCPPFFDPDMDARSIRISEILIKSCLTNPFCSYHYEYSCNLEMYITMMYNDPFRTFKSGSASEFYIVPLLPCVGDVDLMYYSTGFLARFGETTDATSLFQGSEELFKVFEIEETPETEEEKCPMGYYYLRERGKCLLEWVEREYEKGRDPRNAGCYLKNNISSLLCVVGVDRPYKFSGPAMVGEVKPEHQDNMTLTHDIVHSIRCQNWPPIAEPWKLRKRTYQWPSSATISEVLHNGCDLVAVAHRDFPENLFQWRLSFSRAEVTLIRSWTPIQQILYHMLRYFAKQQLCRKDYKGENQIFCMFHLKTLMLWACELKSSYWWKSNCVLGLCSQLLGTLKKWIGKKYCPHYFIPQWNLFDYKMNQSRIDETLEMLSAFCNVQNLTDWFQTYYILKVVDVLVMAQLFTPADSFHILDTSRDCTVLYQLMQDFLTVDNTYLSTDFNRYIISNHYYNIHWTDRAFRLILSNSFNSQPRQLLDLASVFLRLAWNVTHKEVKELSNVEVLDVIGQVVVKLSNGNLRDYPSHSTLDNVGRWLLFIKGKTLLSSHCIKHTAAYYLQFKTCKRYFKCATNTANTSPSYLSDMCHLYLSALYYVSTVNKEKALQHCNKSNFMRYLDHKLECSTLMFVDEVASVCGFLVLYNRYILEKSEASEINLSGLSVMCLWACLMSFLSGRKHPERYYCMKPFIANLLSPFDKCVSAACFNASRKIRGRKRGIFKTQQMNPENPESIRCSSKDTLLEILVKLSVTNFIKFHELECTVKPTFRESCCPGVSAQFRALYHYRRKEYAKVLTICNSIISQEDIARILADRRTYPFACDPVKFLGQYFYHVPVTFAFQVFFGDDVVFLTGLLPLINRDLTEKLHEMNFHFRPPPIGYVAELRLKQQEPPHTSSSRKIERFRKRTLMEVFLRRHIWAQLSFWFSIFYLRFQSLVELGQKSDILSALRDLKCSSSELIFERILIFFLTRLLHRKAKKKQF